MTITATPEVDDRGVEVIEIQALSSVLGLVPMEVRKMPVDTPQLFDVIRVGHAVLVIDGVPQMPPAPSRGSGGCGCS